MARRKPKYDASCYYGDKLLGHCTVADGQAFTTMMESCGGDANRVMREYAYFSPELKAILENAITAQAVQNHHPPPSLFNEPKHSPWGDIDYCETLCTGVFLVSTMGHGGIMVAKDMELVLSPAARKHGERYNGFRCYEEDNEESIVMRELLDKKLWEIPDRVKDKVAFEERINDTLKEYHPDYWRSRENGRSRAVPINTTPTHNER